MFPTIAFLLVLMGSSAAWAQERTFEELKRIQSADPAADLRVAIGKGDYRFLAVMGYSTPWVPGVDAPYPSSYGIRVIEGTSDFITHEVKVAIEYAERYNKLLLKKIRDREGEKGNR